MSGKKIIEGLQEAVSVYPRRSAWYPVAKFDNPIVKIEMKRGRLVVTTDKMTHIVPASSTLPPSGKL